MQFIRNGEKCDTPAGIAHYLEHKMFDTKDGNALQVLSQNGAEPNAFTSNAMTGYYFDCTEHFEENLRILLSFVSVPYFTDESVEKERGIIGQEIRMVEDSPDWQVYERLLACLYRSSPARVPIAGTVESIAGITAETLYDCHHAFYCPSNMALCIVGNVDPHAVIALAEEVLPRERGEEIARCYGEEEDGAAAQKETVTQMEVALPQFLVGFKCEADEGDLLRQSLIGEMASDVLLGDSSPLYQRLYDEGLINGSFGGGFDQLPGVACLCAGGNALARHVPQRRDQLVLVHGNTVGAAIRSLPIVAAAHPANIGVLVGANGAPEAPATFLALNQRRKQIFVALALPINLEFFPTLRHELYGLFVLLRLNDPQIGTLGHKPVGFVLFCPLAGEKVCDFLFAVDDLAGV